MFSGAEAPRCRLPPRPPKRGSVEDGTDESKDEQSTHKCKKRSLGNASHTDQDTACAQDKSSGVPWVTWNKRDKAWQVHKRVKGKVLCKFFYPAKHHMPGMSWEEAEKAALSAASSFLRSSDETYCEPGRRSKQVVRKIGECDPELLQSGMAGVSWQKKRQCWTVQIAVKGKVMYGGRFRPMDGSPQEVEKARQAAILRRRELERQREQGNAPSTPP